MKIKATPIKAKDLKPGDLFSTAPQLYWDKRDPNSLGEKVYMRTDAPTPKDQAEEEIYLIEFIHGHKARHEFLHRCLDELIADFIDHTGELPSKTSLLALMEWSHEQTQFPREK